MYNQFGVKQKLVQDEGTHNAATYWQGDIGFLLLQVASNTFGLQLLHMDTKDKLPNALLTRKTSNK